MLYFKADHRSKYALEAFNLIAQVEGLLTPRMSHELVWNRCCNPNGGTRKNISLDLHCEHLNRVFKDQLNTFRANIGDHSVDRSAKAIGRMQEMMSHLDKQIGFYTSTGDHIDPSSKEDFQRIMDTLNKRTFSTKSLDAAIVLIRISMLILLPVSLRIHQKSIPGLNQNGSFYQWNNNLTKISNNVFLYNLVV